MAFFAVLGYDTSERLPQTAAALGILAESVQRKIQWIEAIVSRNPLLGRVLAALGYMRELGEGIPRMFAEMEREGFYPPRFDSIGGLSFQVALRNQPVYDRDTSIWLQQFSDLGLSGDQGHCTFHRTKAGVSMN